MSAERSIVADLPEIQVWTDGSCDNTAKTGGYAALLRFGAHTKQVSGYLENTTSQRCEMVALIHALKRLKERCRVSVYTDSRYLMDGASSWVHQWVAKGQLHTKANADLWSELLSLMEEHEVRFEKVKAHSGVDLNEVVDRMANEARRGVGHEDGARAPVAPEKGQLLQFPSRAVTEQPRVAQRVQWPKESEDLYAKFGREVTRLYPYVQHGDEEVPKVMTPLGVGTIKQAFSDGVKVALDKPVHWLYSKSGKPSPAMEEFEIGEVWPCDEGAEREIGERASSDERTEHHRRGDSLDSEEGSERGDGDTALLQKRRSTESSATGTEESEVDAQRAASQSEQQLSLL